jgi:predicted DNA-binding transcriptional regulator AlpA
MDKHDILNSWKEIAVYMGRAVRTVQRWEKECQLPVHRPHGRKRDSVFALQSEIDRWLQKCPAGESCGISPTHATESRVAMKGNSANL